MTPEEYLKQGDVDNALHQLQDAVRGHPSDGRLRIFLFQLLSVLGQWDRALSQLKLAADLDEGALAMRAMYKEVINCEALREEVFQGLREPVVFGDPQQWVALLIQSLKTAAEGQLGTSLELREQAFEMAPATSGEIDGTPFSWIADADTRLGPIVEAIIEGRYMWVPFQYIQSIDIEPPEDLRDKVWLPAHFSWVNGGESYGLIPTRYPESYRDEDSQVVLSRKTVWKELAPDFYVGYGQRLLATDESEYPLMDTRAIRLNTQGSQAGNDE